MCTFFAPALLRQFLCVCLLGLTGLLPAQVAYEPGYLISTEGFREPVEIQNFDWRYNPERITVLRDGLPVEIMTARLKEFGIAGKARYVNHTVQLERSHTETRRLARAPAASREERVLLRAEVEGPASLYSYRTEEVTKYFFQLDPSTPPVQLAHQRWLDAQNKVKSNDQYISQLRSALKCDDLAPDRGIRYTLRELRRYILAYNACMGAQSEIYANNGAQTKRLYVGVTPGLFLNQYRINQPGADRMLVTMDSKTSFRIGAELEYRLPFARNKFALVLEPNYYSYTSSGEYSPVSRIEMAMVDYSMLEIPVGIRYYSFVGTAVKVFATLSAGYNFALSGAVAYDRGPADEVNGSFGASGGVGLRILDHYGLEARYYRSTDNLQVLSRDGRVTGIRLIGSYIF